MTVDAKQIISDLHTRAGWYRLLAGVFAEEPKSDFLQALLDDKCHAALIELGVQFDDDVLKIDLTELVENLACEYTMLFIAPGGFPAVESVRLQGGFSQNSMAEVKNIYQTEQIVIKNNGFNTFDDHLSAELGFLAIMFERQANAMEHNDGIEAKRLEKVIKRFWVQHPGRWVRGFATLIEEVAEHSFYREMSILLNAFTESELELLKITVNDDDGGRWRAPKPVHLTQPMQCGGA